MEGKIKSTSVTKIVLSLKNANQSYNNFLKDLGECRIVKVLISHYSNLIGATAKCCAISCHGIVLFVYPVVGI